MLASRELAREDGRLSGSSIGGFSVALGWTGLEADFAVKAGGFSVAEGVGGRWKDSSFSAEASDFAVMGGSDGFSAEAGRTGGGGGFSADAGVAAAVMVGESGFSAEDGGSGDIAVVDGLPAGTALGARDVAVTGSDPGMLAKGGTVAGVETAATFRSAVSTVAVAVARMLAASRKKN